jgi:cytochrome c
LTVIAQNQRRFDASAEHAGAKVLINKSDCNACHALNAKSLGPSLTQVALKYKGDKTAENKLIKKIINGGSGVWGDAMMPAHSSMNAAEVRSIVKYVLSLSEKKAASKNLPVTGTYVTREQPDQTNKGSYIFRAAYKDKGAGRSGPQLGESLIVLRHPLIQVSDMAASGGIEFFRNKSVAGAKEKGAHLLLKNIDLTDIKTVEIIGTNRKSPGSLTIRLDAPDGMLIGKAVSTSSETKAVVTQLTPTNGKHDLYLVFEEAGGQITSILVKDR